MPIHVVKKLMMLILFIIGVASISYADTNKPPALSRISYQLSTEQWAGTATAEVSMDLYALQDKLGTTDINQHMLQKLNKIAQADWHITEFNRNQDSSGVERVSISAKARVPSNLLATLRDKAQANSQPGETYKVTNIDFTPSVAEIEKAHVQARATLYGLIAQEINRLNQAYPAQHYFVYAINFNSGNPPPAGFVAAPQPMVSMSSRAGFAGSPPPSASPEKGSANLPSAVENKILETADVVIAARLPGDNKPVPPVAKNDPTQTN